jgi:RHS repeat-associated protein
MTFFRTVSATCFCLLALSFCSLSAADQVVFIDTTEPSFGPSPFASDDNKAATTAHPVHLYRGSVIENAQDLTLETPLATWTNKRTYDSGLRIGEMGSEAPASWGQRWRGDTHNMVLHRRGHDIDLVMTSSNRERFTANSNGFTPTPNYDATLEIVSKGTADERYILTQHTTGNIFVFYGFANPVDSSLRGKLNERTNRYYYASGLAGETYVYDRRGFIVLIITASPQAYAIRYTYNETGMAVNRLHKIEIFDSLAQDGSAKKLSEAIYTYWEEVNGAHNDVGDFGDLIQVKVSKLQSDNVSWKTKTTQYRYHRTSANLTNSDIHDGNSHQLKLVLEPEVVAQIISENSDISNPEDIFRKSDTEPLGKGSSVYAYSSRAFAYYATNLNTNENVTTPWGNENLSFRYGGEDMVEIFPVRNEPPVPRVKRERINAGCLPCGGSESGVEKLYFYMALNVGSTSPNAVTTLVVEDSQDSRGTPYMRTIYALNSSGVRLRKIDIENPTAPTLNTVATSKTLTSRRKTFEERPEDAHLLIRSDAQIKQFLNPFDPSGNSWANDTATLEPNRGVISVFEYDAQNNQTATKRKVGSAGTTYYVSATDYNDRRDIVAEYIYPTKSTVRDALDRFTTRFEYTYWDTGQKAVKTKKTIRQAIPESQNGTGTVSVTDEYFDESGNRRWGRDTLGMVTYYGVHPTSGRRTLTIRDVDTNSPPTLIANGSGESVAWKGSVPFAREIVRSKQLSSVGQDTAVIDAKPANRISITNSDKQGNLVMTRRADGNVDYTVKTGNRTMRFPAWDAQAGQPMLPISVVENDDFGRTLEEYELPPSAVVVANSKPTGIQERVTKNTWIRYTYDDHPSSLKRVDRYHTIPSSGQGTLGANFYRTVTIRDLRGRVVATARYIADGRWQVNARKLDWRGRTIETWRGEAMNPPTFADLETPMFLNLISKTIYDGSRVGLRLSYFGTSENDYIGTRNYYDDYGRLRAISSYHVQGGKETSFGPFSVRDYTWKGNLIATAVFEKEPNWKDVLANENFASVTTQGRYRLIKNYYTPTKRSYRQEIYGENPSRAIRTSNTYFDEKDRRVVMQNENGLHTETVYDPLGRVVEVRTSDGKNLIKRSQTEYNDLGRVIAKHDFYYRQPSSLSTERTQSDSARQTVYFWHDNAGRVIAQAQYGCGTDLLSSTPPAARPQIPPRSSTKEWLVTHTVYDPATGKANIHTDQRGVTNRTVPDALGRVTSRIANYAKNSAANDHNIETKYEYDGLGRTIAQIDPLGHVVRTEYDTLGRVVANIDALRNRSTRTYDLHGRILSATDPLRRTTNYEYDAQRRLVRTILPAPSLGATRSVQQVEYDSFNRVIKAIDPLSHVSQTVYDEFGNVARRIGANKGVTSFTYDANGRLLTLTDSVDNTTTFEYNVQGQVIKETNGLDKSRHFDYLGQWLIRKVDRNGRVTEYVYDRFARPKEERWLEGSHVVKKIVRDYNEIGDLVALDDGIAAFTYEYDAFQREMKCTIKFNGLAKEMMLLSAYDKRGQRVLSEVDDISTQYTYTPVWFVESIDQKDVSVRYSYDAASRRISARTPAVDSTYAHDDMGRLTQINHGNIARYDYTWDVASRITSMNDGKYGYDKTSQLVSATYDRSPAEKYEYDLNGNRLSYTTGRNNQLLHDGRFIYQYDDEGNRTAKGATKYFWDHRNRLIKVETPEETVEYVYDHRNRLVKRVTSKDVEHFVHDGWQIVAILDGDGNDKERFFWGAKQDELIAQNSVYTLCDHLGTVRSIVGSDTATRLEYDAFGRLISKSGNVDSRFKFTGKMTDDVTGLQWNINRWYDSSVGRWISEDPIGFSGRDVNLFRYVNNNTISNTDPLGLSTQELTQEQKDDCCEKGHEQTVLDVSRLGGVTMCCCNQTIICDYSDQLDYEGIFPNTYVPPEARAINNECIIVHENVHLNDENLDCKGKGTTAKSGEMMLGGDLFCSEAHAWQASVECLESGLDKCSDCQCYEAVRKMLNIAIQEAEDARKFCDIFGH